MTKMVSVRNCTKLLEIQQQLLKKWFNIIITEMYHIQQESFLLEAQIA